MKKIKCKAIVLCLLIIMFINGTTGYAAQSETQAKAQDNQNTVKEEIINPTEIDLGDYQSEMLVGEKQLLSVTVLPTNVTDQTVIYQSSDQGVATINGMGRITAISKGTTQITATCGSIQNEFSLTV
ncbi:Ig-like domain-containing protein [Candidatus Galacturonibacter soehngenii]|uniref:Ig-like domain-containing protein n=1 Tax=Candidatus Galacturonatibacter soehngenii TaxID=2307010 RepID=A0A7V7QIY4_9FIRM|nr:Ig-like domain-containing protein [Candidatus Galacturonibacter soehngenii]KAB1435916.1 Ig-like domain-containing protein [Candidatus Galacturonibacter soehngenii]MBA4688307.1 Ig-like domain-containing protein [Candidatus Galacturonibacter soehngenii]